MPGHPLSSPHSTRRRREGRRAPRSGGRAAWPTQTAAEWRAAAWPGLPAAGDGGGRIAALLRLRSRPQAPPKSPGPRGGQRWERLHRQRSDLRRIRPPQSQLRRPGWWRTPRAGSRGTASRSKALSSGRIAEGPAGSSWRRWTPRRRCSTPSSCATRSGSSGRRRSRLWGVAARSDRTSRFSTGWISKCGWPDRRPNALAKQSRRGQTLASRSDRGSCTSWRWTRTSR